MELPSLLERLLGRMRQRLDGMVSRSVVTGVDDLQAMQRGQLERRAGEVVGNAEIVWPPGHRANVTGGEAMVFAVGGSPNHLFAVPLGVKGGPDLAAGEVAVFGPGGHVHFKANGELWVRGTSKVVLRHGEGGHWISIRPDGIRASTNIVIAGGEP